MTMLKEEASSRPSSQRLDRVASGAQQLSEQQQNNKDRTLFCINIDPKTSEEILYELFLQAGPIENLVRKADRNGNLICLVTYKHMASCEYAVNVFNGINLYNQSMKVQFSQNSALGANASTPGSRAQSQSGGHQRRPLQSDVPSQIPPQPLPLLMQPPAPEQLLHLMMQTFSPPVGEFGMNYQQTVFQNMPFMGGQQQQFARSRSNGGGGFGGDEYGGGGDHQSRRSHHSFEQKQRGGSSRDSRIVDMSGGREVYQGGHDYRSNDRQRDYSNGGGYKGGGGGRDRRFNDRSRSRSPQNHKRNRR